jgi:flagellar hook protein FlgE
MFDTLFIATSGLMSHAKGLRTVGNNLANVNTPGFKAAQQQFGALFGQGAQQGGQGQGVGVQAAGTQVMFKAGTEQGTGNALDLSINGNGMFAVKRDGKVLYTRDGGFQFNGEDILVNAAGDHVQALDGSGALVDVKLGDLYRNAPKATTSVKFLGNLSTVIATPPVDATVNGVTLYDSKGVSHTVNLSFKDGGTVNGSNTFTVTIKDGVANGATLGTGTIVFDAGAPQAGKDKITFDYKSTGVSAFKVELDFSKAGAAGSPTTLQANQQDGYAPGVRTDQSFDKDGLLTVTYSNGQKVKGPRLALADFAQGQDLEQMGGSMFALRAGGSVRYGFAATESFGTLAAGRREGSNVDMAEEFGNLILMQRGYQASSHVISTANDMIQQLFDMKGR